MDITPTRERAIVASTAWAGCDVAKESFEAALMVAPDGGAVVAMGRIPVRRFERTRQGVAAFVAWAEGFVEAESQDDVAPMRVVMEATGRYSLELALWLIAERAELAPAIVNPHTTSAFTKSLALRNKSDKTDARALARYGVERSPAPFEPPSGEHAELRDLSRHRQALISMRVAEENRFHDGSASPLVLRMQKTHVGRLKRDIERIEKRMVKVLERLPQLKADVEALDGIYGVGLITALTVVAELGDLRRFHHGRQLSAFSGLSPRNFDSGKSVHKRPKMCKMGSSHVRRALFMPALCIIRGDNDMANMYRRMVAAGKKKKAALGAVMRKLLLIMRAVLISGKPYQRHYGTCGKLPENLVEKVEISP